MRTVLVYLAVVVAMRMGKRQLGELQPAELVTTLLISNVASIWYQTSRITAPLPACATSNHGLEILNPTPVCFARNMPSRFWESR